MCRSYERCMLIFGNRAAFNDADKRWVSTGESGSKFLVMLLVPKISLPRNTCRKRLIFRVVFFISQCMTLCQTTNARLTRRQKQDMVTEMHENMTNNRNTKTKTHGGTMAKN